MFTVRRYKPSGRSQPKQLPANFFSNTDRLTTSGVVVLAEMIDFGLAFETEGERFDFFRSSVRYDGPF